MPRWVDRALKQASEIAKYNGRYVLEENLIRINNILSYDDMMYFKDEDCEVINENLITSSSIDDLMTCIDQISTVFGIDFCSFCVVDESSGKTFNPKIITNYPSWWVTRYIESSYDGSDPIMMNAKITQRAFYWDELVSGGEDMQLVLKEAERNDLAKSGFVAVSKLDTGDKFALVASSRDGAENFRDFFKDKEEDFCAICDELSYSMYRIVARNREIEVSLSSNMSAYMRAVASGATDDELEELDYVFGSHKTMETSVCRLFQARTLTEAMVIATRSGFLSEPPLSISDVRMVGDSKRSELDVALVQTIHRDTQGSMIVLEPQPLAIASEGEVPQWVHKPSND